MSLDPLQNHRIVPSPIDPTQRGYATTIQQVAFEAIQQSSGSPAAAAMSPHPPIRSQGRSMQSLRAGLLARGTEVSPLDTIPDQAYLVGE